MDAYGAQHPVYNEHEPLQRDIEEYILEKNLQEERVTTDVKTN